jgi:hypothetical protein
MRLTWVGVDPKTPPGLTIQSPTSTADAYEDDVMSVLWPVILDAADDGHHTPSSKSWAAPIDTDTSSSMMLPNVKGSTMSERSILFHNPIGDSSTVVEGEDAFTRGISAPPPVYRWTCCQCGMDCSYKSDHGCPNCCHHWRSNCCYFYNANSPSYCREHTELFPQKIPGVGFWTCTGFKETSGCEGRCLKRRDCV